MAKVNTVDATPVKEFFVKMLTRDISLEDSILDLLDNCVDGILRNLDSLKGSKPYSGYWAEIEFDGNKFSITDNCGGIPKSLFDYAFRMGSKQEDTKRPIGSLGAYGIGMKRAIFKIGRKCSIITRNEKKSFEFSIKENWLDDEKNWEIPYESVNRKLDSDGTKIEISELNDVIAKTFGDDRVKFESDLMDKIENHYSFIIGKGFKIKVNHSSIKHNILKFAFADKKAKESIIQPYIFTAQENGMTIFLAVGFTEPLQTEDEENEYDPKYSGWNIVCNDRTVLYGDKTINTGWGWGGTPSYHPQYNPIVGFVEFHSDDPQKLPTTTTKNGVDLNSEIYIRVLDKMREGIRPFINYTNNWKGDYLKKGKKLIEDAPKIDIQDIKEKSKTLSLSIVSKTISGKQYKPDLPTPPKKGSDFVKISFTRKKNEVKKVSTYLFNKEDVEPKMVGERCFTEILKEASR